MTEFCFFGDRMLSTY